MKLNEYASMRRTHGTRKIPKSVQQSIPIEEIYPDGTWRSGEVYSRMWSISDINYAMLGDDQKKSILTLYGAVYAGIPADCWAKFSIVSQHIDEQAFKEDILFESFDPIVEEYRTEWNTLLSDCAEKTGNVVQKKYLIVSTTKPEAAKAQSRLQQVQGHLISALSALGCTVRSVNNNDRLRLLHNFFRAGEEKNFRFDINECKRFGQDFKDCIAPDSMRFLRDNIEIDNRFARCMSIADYPQRLEDDLIVTLLEQVPYIVLSIDVVPVETEDAYKEIAAGRMKADADKVRFNRKSVDNLDFTSNVPQHVQNYAEIVETYQRDLSENDQQMFLTLLTVAYFADDMQELEQHTDALKTIAAYHNCRFIDLRFQQERAFQTAMPYGLRRIENMRTMTTENVAALVPFNTQEVLEAGGIYYGTNALSGRLIMGQRTALVNGNAMVVATSGGGKSMFVKQEIMQLFLRYPKAKFAIADPENEYAPVVQALGGVVVDIAVDSKTFFNPLDFTYDPVSKVPPDMAKVEFVLSLCEQIMGKNNMQPSDKSLIDRSLKRIYKPLVRSHYTADCPTLTDLWSDLSAQKEERAKEIALALEIFATGSLNMFAKPTNVDMQNRLICFNVQSLGEQMKPVAMLSMLEFINVCVMNNDRNDPAAATWVYFDEIYLLMREELSAQFLYSSWKRFRKYNAYATGITQNVQDCLANEKAYAILANSEFVAILRQTKDIDSVAELYDLSEPQRNYLLLAQPGQGILKMGNALIPFENDFPKNTKSYWLCGQYRRFHRQPPAL